MNLRIKGIYDNHVMILRFEFSGEVQAYKAMSTYQQIPCQGKPLSLNRVVCS